MNILYFMLLSIFSIVIQTTILKHFSILGVTPNIVLIIIVSYSIFKGKFKGAFLGIFLGLLQDIIISSTLGINALIYFLIGYTVGIFNDIVFKDNPFTSIVFVSLSTFFYHTILFIFMFFIFNGGINFTFIFRRIILIEVFYNSIISILVFKVFQKTFNKSRFKFK